MPYTKAHKARTRARIVEAAVHAVRTRGVEGVAIADLMRDAGLTHGGFYAHFASKDALVAEATRQGVEGSRRAFLTAAAQANPAAPLREIIRRYVSRQHRDEPAKGCAMPACVGEMAHESPAVRRAFTEAVEDWVNELAPYVPGDSPAACRDGALVLAAGMAGAVALARAVDDPSLSDRILLAARHFYTATLASANHASLGVHEMSTSNAESAENIEARREGQR